MAIILRQKCICGSFGIQIEDDKTAVESRTREHHFENAGCVQLADSQTIFTAADSERASYFCELSYLAFVLPSEQYIKGPWKSQLQATGLQTLIPAIDIEVGLWPSFSPSWYSLGAPGGNCGSCSYSRFLNAL